MTRTFLPMLCLAILVGCGSPSKPNIELRKKNQELQAQIDMLQRQHVADQASLAAMDQKAGSTPTLSSDRLSELVTVAQIEISKLTGMRPEGLKLYVTPRDVDGDILKAAGTITVDVFDLSRKEQPSLGQWTYNPKDLGKQWYESPFVNGFAMTVPLQIAAPTELTIRVTFKDLLTQRTLTNQKVLKIAPPTTQPGPDASPMRG